MRQYLLSIAVLLTVLPAFSQPTAKQWNSEVTAGWNLGNQLECSAAGMDSRSMEIGLPDSHMKAETAWGNPKVTRKTIKAVKEAGFNAVRIPIRWQCHITNPHAMTIDKDWMKHVREVIDWCLAEAVKFIAGSEFVEKANFNVTTETVLWEGEWQVTWGTPFNALQSAMPSLVHAGNIVRVYVSGNGQGTMTTAWWNNILTGLGDPDRNDIMISGDMVLEFLLTDYSMELMNSQDGVLIVGDGYTIHKVTVE